MYRQRSGAGCSLTLIVIIGIVAGVVYLIYDNRVPPPPERTELRPPTATIPTPTVPPGLQVAAALPAPREVTAGAMFFAPTAGIQTRIVTSYLDGTSWDVTDLGAYAGHLQGTAWVDTPGNIVLAGHAEAFSGQAGIFSTVERLRPGDPLIITQDGREYVYNVVEVKRTEPGDLSPFYPVEGSRLTLTTCSDYDFLQNAYRERIVVIAERKTA